LSISENTRVALREMGLNAYEIDTYTVLLEEGQMTAMEISRKASVPYSKIYEVLNSLKEKGWVKSSESRPTKYHPVPPIEAAAFTKLKVEDRYQQWEQVVAEELQPLYEKRAIVERADILMLHGQQAVTAKLEEVFKKATKEIMIAAPQFAISIMALAESLLGNIKKTVNIKLMVAGKTEDWLFLKKSANVSELRVRDHMFGGGVIADEKEAMLFWAKTNPA
jgi:sugar-specific transcriptional regulator TrmB